MLAGGAVEIVKSVLTLDTDQYNEALGNAKNGAMDLVKTLGPKVGVAGAIALVGKYIYENTKEMYEFNRTLTRGNAELRNNTQALNEYGSRVTKVARDASMSYNSIALAQEYARKEGYDLNDSLKVTEASAELANATNEALEGTISGLVGTMKAFNIEADDAKKANDALGFVLNNTTWSSGEVTNSFRKLGNEAKLAGMTIEDMSIFLVNQSNAGVDSRRAMRNLESAIKGNGDAIRATTTDIENYNSQMGTVAKDAEYNKITFSGEIQRWKDLNKEVWNTAGTMAKVTQWFKEYNDHRENTVKNTKEFNDLLQIEKDLLNGVYGTDYVTPLRKRQEQIKLYNDAVAETNRLYLENQKLVQANTAEINKGPEIKSIEDFNNEKLALELKFAKEMSDLKNSGGSEEQLKDLDYKQREQILKNDLDYYTKRDDMQKKATEAEIALLKHGLTERNTVNDEGKIATEEFNNTLLGLELTQLNKMAELKKEGLLSDVELKQVDLANKEDLLNKQLEFYESQTGMETEVLNTKMDLKKNEIEQYDLLNQDELTAQEQHNIDMLNLRIDNVDKLNELRETLGTEDIEVKSLELVNQQEELEAQLAFYQSQEGMLAETLQTQLALKENAIAQSKILADKENVSLKQTEAVKNKIMTGGKQALDKVLSDAIAGRVTNIAELGKALTAEVSQQAISGATQATIDGWVAMSTGHVLASNPATAGLAPNAFAQSAQSFRIAGTLGAIGAVTGLVSSAIPGGSESDDSSNSSSQNTSVSDTTDSVISSTEEDREPQKVIRVGGVEAITTLIDKFLGNKYNTTITGKRR